MAITMKIRGVISCSTTTRCTLMQCFDANWRTIIRANTVCSSILDSGRFSFPSRNANCGPNGSDWLRPPMTMSITRWLASYDHSVCMTPWKDLLRATFQMIIAITAKNATSNLLLRIANITVVDVDGCCAKRVRRGRWTGDTEPPERIISSDVFISIFNS